MNDLPVAVLLDLDGTILRDNIFLPQAAVLTEAITAIYGFDAGIGPDHVPVEVQVDWVGKTDCQIALEICERAGVPEDVRMERLPAWRAEYVQRFQARCPVLLTPRESVVELIEVLRDEGVEIRVVTGNLREVATMKLEVARISHFFNLEQSATGSESYDRTGLCTIARDGTCKAVVVGDTWRDVRGAREAGLPCVALATPRHSARKLSRAGAEIVVQADDAEAVITAVQRSLNGAGTKSGRRAS